MVFLAFEGIMTVPAIARNQGTAWDITSIASDSRTACTNITDKAVSDALWLWGPG